jgi:uncharacterized protein (TIGR03435 family)
MKRLREYLKQTLAPFRTVSSGEVETAWERVLERLREEPQDVMEYIPAELSRFPKARTWRRRALVLAAAAVIVVGFVSILIVSIVRLRSLAHGAVVEGSVYRVSGDTKVPLQIGERIRTGEIIGSNGGAGSVLVLADGSSIEVRSGSELWLERADDGVRIRLSKGGILVNAARQRAGHLYVQTKDVTVSVIGTVFFVDAEEEGSRVAVIEGEVRVQQGVTEKKLRPGEQVMTNPTMEPQHLTEEISWSRNADEHVVLLQQSTAVPAADSPDRGADSREAFEVASIRPSLPTSAGGRGGGLPRFSAGCSGIPQVNPGRLVVTNVTLYTLITMAYGSEGRNCGFYSFTELVSGGPGWINSDQFDLQAVIPKGSPSYTLRQFQNGDALKLKGMLRTLLEDRFKLVVSHEMKDMPVYELRLGRAKDAVQLADLAAATIRRSPDVPQFPQMSVELPAGRISTEGEGLWGLNASMPELASYLARLTGQPVFDRTGLTANITFHIQYERVPDGFAGVQGMGRPFNASSISNLRAALRDQLGLELEGGKAPMGVLVIDRAERPSEN